MKATALEKAKVMENAKEAKFVVVMIMKTMKLFVSAIYIDGVVDQQHLYLVVSDEQRSQNRHCS